jgi:hypothetical protein
MPLPPRLPAESGFLASTAAPRKSAPQTLVTRRSIVIALRAFLLTAWLITAYLVVAAAAELGFSGSLIWFTDFAHAWRLMFYTDFTFYLLLAALWILYREDSPAIGISCAILSAALGSIFTLAYLFITTFRARGDIHAFLMGARASKPEVGRLT